MTAADTRFGDVVRHLDSRLTMRIISIPTRTDSLVKCRWYDDGQLTEKWFKISELLLVAR